MFMWLFLRGSWVELCLLVWRFCVSAWILGRTSSVPFHHLSSPFAFPSPSLFLTLWRMQVENAHPKLVPWSNENVWVLRSCVEKPKAWALKTRSTLRRVSLNFRKTCFGFSRNMFFKFNTFFDQCINFVWTLLENMDFWQFVSQDMFFVYNRKVHARGFDYLVFWCQCRRILIIWSKSILVSCSFNFMQLDFRLVLLLYN